MNDNEEKGSDRVSRVPASHIAYDHGWGTLAWARTNRRDLLPKHAAAHRHPTAVDLDHVHPDG